MLMNSLSCYLHGDDVLNNDVWPHRSTPLEYAIPTSPKFDQSVPGANSKFMVFNLYLIYFVCISDLSDNFFEIMCHYLLHNFFCF